MRRACFTSALLIAAVLTAPAAANVIDVFAQEFQFVPAEVGIAPGDSIRWTNVMLATHTVTNGTGSSDPLAGSIFDEVLVSEAQFAFQFDSLGVYPYFCRPHEEMNMRGTIFVSGFPAAIEDEVRVAPTLLPIAPNPSSRTASVAFALGRAARARLEIFDAQGRRIAVVFDEDTSAGFHRRAWDGRDAAGRDAPSGIYFARLTAGGQAESRRFVRLH